MVLWLSVLVAGCTETVRLSRDPLDNLVALDVTPGDPAITITDLALPHHTLQFTAMGRFADGSTRDVTPLVQWSVDNGRLGSFDERGLFTASHAAAGYATVSIEARGLASTTALTVVVDATIIDPAFPPPAANLFDAAIPLISGDATRSPTLIYPADDTLFPLSIASTLFQYQLGQQNDAYRIVFSSDVLHLAVETGADRWRADGTVQRLLAATGIAGPIRTEIQATSSTLQPATIYVGNRITLEFSPDSPGGPLYFWSAATNGIMRGGVDTTTSGKLYPSSTTCVGCHVVSRDGTQLAMGAGDPASPDLHAIDVGTQMSKINPSSTRPMGWATYSPDGTQLVVASYGALSRYNAATGAFLGTVPLPAMRYATHPDWSPAGTYLVVALTSQLPTNLDVRGASIARIPYTNGAFGAPEIVVAGSMTNNNYFPKWSPDGKWLAYVRATTQSQGATSAELMVVEAMGGTPRRLRLASHRVGTLDDVPDLASSMPTWAPREPEQGERAWLAFTSARPYGAVLPTASRGQIWVTSLDLANPDDPSTPAFWLPCQDTTVLNNNPVWTKTDFTQ
jgi:TolB protein